MPVLCLETKSILGKVLDIVADPKNGQVLAFLVSDSIFFNPKVVSCQDIITIKPDFIIVPKETALVKPEEIVKVAEILKNKTKIINNWVKNQRGEWLGKVEDVLIETESMVILKYYLKGTALGFQTQPFLGTFKENRIISADKIISITAKAIVVKDESEMEEKEKIKATVPELA